MARPRMEFHRREIGVGEELRAVVGAEVAEAVETDDDAELPPFDVDAPFAVAPLL